tara:strand:- start:179 stop:589 length:411 start_codon:yes stop_codon:yes gene_type:complete
MRTITEQLTYRIINEVLSEAEKDENPFDNPPDPDNPMEPGQEKPARGLDDTDVDYEYPDDPPVSPQKKKRLDDLKKEKLKEIIPTIRPRPEVPVFDDFGDIDGPRVYPNYEDWSNRPRRRIRLPGRLGRFFRFFGL